MIDLDQLIIDSNRRIARADLECLQRVCERIQARRILEIGSADGGSSVVLADQAHHRRGHLWCVEPKPKGRMKANLRDRGLLEAVTVLPYASPWVPPSQVPENLDLLFIDGCHELRWCLVDYHFFVPKVRRGGAICFHDTAGQCQEDKRQPDYGRPGYKPLVARAIEIILTTDPLQKIDESVAVNGGVWAFKKGEQL